MGRIQKGKLVTEVDQEIIDDLDDLSARTRKSRAELMRVAITEFLERSRTFDGAYAATLANSEKRTRPKEYSPELAAEIFNRLTTPVIDGGTQKTMYPSLTSVCAAPDMPTLPLAVQWNDDIPEFAQMIDKSKDLIAHSLMDKLVETLQVVDATNSRDTSPAVATLLSTLKQVAPKIFSPSSALTQLVEDKVVFNLILKEK
jgi:predicted transcriptional regulator